MANYDVFTNEGFPDVRGGKGMLHTRSMRGADSFLKPRFLETVLRRYPGGNVSLSALIDKISRKSVTTTDIVYRIKNIRYPTLTLLEDMPQATRLQSSTIKVSDTSMILPNMVFTVAPFGEQIMVTSIPGDHEIVVIRGMGTVLPYGASAGTVLQFSGNAFEEGSLRPLGRHTYAEEMYTQTQIFRNGWATTETMHLVAAASGVNVTAESKMEAAEQHAMDIESAVLFGQQSNTVRNGKPMRTFSGLFDVLRWNAPYNIKMVDGDVSYDDLVDILDSLNDVRVTPNPSDKRVIYGDKTFVNAIHQVGMKYADKIMYTQNNVDSFGMRFRSFITPRMSFEVYEHPIFSVRNMPRGMAFVVDPSTMELHYMRDTQVSYLNAGEGGNNPRSVDGGVDARGGDFLSELAFVCTNPAANAVIYGVTGGKCGAGC